MAEGPLRVDFDPITTMGAAKKERHTCQHFESTNAHDMADVAIPTAQSIDPFQFYPKVGAAGLARKLLPSRDRGLAESIEYIPLSGLPIRLLMRGFAVIAVQLIQACAREFCPDRIRILALEGSYQSAVGGFFNDAPGQNSF